MKSITKILLAALLLINAGNTYAAKTATINVRLNETEDRHLSGFKGINVAGPFDVVITQGSVESVKVEAPADVIGKILTEVNGGVLKVYSKRDWSWNNWFGHKKILVYVTAKDLNAISITGSGDVTFREGIKANDIQLRITGSGDMTGKIEARTIESSVTGSGDMRLSGHAQSSTVQVEGSGDYNCSNLTTLSTAVRVSGSGDAYVNASDKLDAAVNGSGDVHYSGSPKRVSKSASGSGEVHGH